MFAERVIREFVVDLKRNPRLLIYSLFFTVAARSEDLGDSTGAGQGRGRGRQRARPAAQILRDQKRDTPRDLDFPGAEDPFSAGPSTDLDALGLGLADFDLPIGPQKKKRGKRTARVRSTDSENEAAGLQDRERPAEPADPFDEF